MSDGSLPHGGRRTFAPLSVNDLAQKANLNKGQASRAAQSLVEQGLVVKAASPTDGARRGADHDAQGQAPPGSAPCRWRAGATRTFLAC